MDLLLANAYMLALDAEEQRVMRPHPPLGLLYLSSHLKSRGIDVGLFDGTFSSLEAFAGVLQRERPPVVGIAANLMTKRSALAMIALAKKLGARVVVGGPDPPYHAQAYLAAGADVVVVGEGEQTLEELLPALLTHRGSGNGVSASSVDWSSIQGIVFKAGDGEIVRTPPRDLLPDLDGQPFPDREAIDLEHYLSTWQTHHGVRSVSLITARGCPYTCSWCSHSVYGRSHRRRSPDNVADEIELIKERYRPDQLWYADDVFTIHAKWLDQLPRS